VRIASLTYADARRQHAARWADLRSPAEHARDHLPGAENVPLLDDQQRAIVGTLYKSVSPDAAYSRGLAFAAAGMPDLLARLLGRAVPAAEWEERFDALAVRLRGGLSAVELERTADLPQSGDGWILLHCWRGGMRSRSVAALLQVLGERAAVLDGGYKSYRAWMMQRLDAWPPAGPNPFILISGATGTGKTLLLRALEAAAPGSVLDLEDLAQHRSSILGAVGRNPVSQAAFESRLAARIEELGPPPWFIEAESRKVGDVILPPRLWSAMREGFVVELTAQPATRVRVLVEDYLDRTGNAAELAARLPFLEQRLGDAWRGRLTALLAAGRPDEVAALLLEHYYDPLYRHSGRGLVAGMTLAAEEPARVERLLALRFQAVELPLGTCAASSASPACPGRTSLPNSTRP
jgi:tRNA 2-selenouridine synthase